MSHNESAFEKSQRFEPQTIEKVSFPEPFFNHLSTISLVTIFLQRPQSPEWYETTYFASFVRKTAKVPF